MTIIGSDAFSGCTELQDLYILLSNDEQSRLYGLYRCKFGTVYAYRSILDKIESKYDVSCQRKVEITNPYFTVSEIRSISPSVLTFRVKEQPCDEDVSLARVEYNGTELYPDASGVYTLTNLAQKSTYTVSLVVVDNATGTEHTYTQKIENVMPDIETDASSDQTHINMTVRTKVTYPGYEPKEIGVKCNGIDFGTAPTIDNGYYKGEFTISDLVPNDSYKFSPYMILTDGTRLEGEIKFYSTQGVSPVISGSFIGPTVYKSSGSHSLGIATLKEEYYTFNGVKYEGNKITVTGLKPNTEYTIEYTVETNEGSAETVSETFTTDILELITLQPKGVSERCSIVAATTNISEEEPNVGFQWKKYDAPASLAPSEGYAAIYNGQIEGYIRNLQPTSYYNVRAFYKSNNGIYYYGDWVTFDPSDFSYFEPTVHTYEATDVTARSAKVKGYVLAGTDNIIEQGFEYWAAGALQSKAMRVPAAVANDVTTVLSTGQVMTATLTNLQPNTTYHFRSFVKTASGTTYGEEQILTTDYDTTGIGSVEASSAEPVVVGYYDLNGRRLEGIGKGITILRYSDGSTRKVVRK